MRLRMLECVVCPACGGGLSLRNPTWVEGEGGEAAEVMEGVLACARGHRFAVAGGVPRLAAEGEGGGGGGAGRSGDAAAISASFSREWGHFAYDDDRTWMQGVEERCKLFLKELGCASAEELRGKLVLDAGCGNASLSMGVMRRFGCEVLAADVSESVVRAYGHFRPRGFGGTHFAQADLMRPPFKKETFDVIYSSGVLHHNRNTREALRAVAAALKPGGRIYIWLYEKQPGVGHRVKQVVRSVVAPMPAAVKHALIYAWLPQSMVRQWVRYHLRGRKPEDRLNWRERMVLLMDHYTPRYRWEHTPGEVHGWFREMGYEGIETTEVRAWGFGVVARKPGGRGEAPREKEAELVGEPAGAV